MKRKTEATKIWLCRKILIISRRKSVSDEDVFRKMETKGSRKTWLKFMGHIKKEGTGI